MSINESESEVWKGYRVFCRMVKGLGLDLELDSDLGDGMGGVDDGVGGSNGGGGGGGVNGGFGIGGEGGDAGNGLGMPFDDGFDWVSFFFPPFSNPVERNNRNGANEKPTRQCGTHSSTRRA